MAIKFNDVTMHGTERFLPNHAYGFEDKGAEDYFKAAFGAEATDEEPEYVFPEGTIEIDPDTVHHDSGMLVSDLVKHGSPERAREAGVQPAGVAGAIEPKDVSVDAASA